MSLSWEWGRDYDWSCWYSVCNVLVAELLSKGGESTSCLRCWVDLCCLFGLARLVLTHGRIEMRRNLFRCQLLPKMVIRTSRWQRDINSKKHIPYHEI